MAEDDEDRDLEDRSQIDHPEDRSDIGQLAAYAQLAQAQQPQENPYARFVQKPQEPQENPYAKFVQQPQENPYAQFVRKEPKPPEAEGAWGTFAREFLHEAPPAVAGAFGGVATGAALGTMGAGPVGTVIGALGGGIAGAYAASKAEKGVSDLLGFDDDLKRTANRQAHPWAAALGDVLPNLIPFGMTRKAGQAAVGLAGRATTGAITGGADVASQYVQSGTVDPATAGLSAATGFVAPYSRGFLAPAERLGAQIGERLKPAFHGAAASDTAGTASERPPPPDARGGNTERDAKQPIGDYEEAPDLSAKPGPTATAEAPAAQPAPAGGTTDPTLNAVFEAQRAQEAPTERPPAAEAPPPPAVEAPAATPTGEAPRTMAAERVPDDVVRGPAGGREYANLVYPEQPSFHDALVSSGHQYETFEGADGKTYHRYTKGGTPQEALAGTLRLDQAPTVGAAPGGRGPAPGEQPVEAGIVRYKDHYTIAGDVDATGELGRHQYRDAYDEKIPEVEKRVANLEKRIERTRKLGRDPYIKDPRLADASLVLPRLERDLDGARFDLETTRRLREEALERTAPATPREAIAQRAPGETVGDALRQPPAPAVPGGAGGAHLPGGPPQRGPGAPGGPPPQFTPPPTPPGGLPPRPMAPARQVPGGPAPPGGGGPPGGAPPLPGIPPPGGGPPAAGNVGAAQAAILARVAQKPSFLSQIPANMAEVKSAWREFYRMSKNELDPLEQLTKQGPPLSADENFSMLARLTNGLAGRVKQQLEHGTYDITTGRPNGKSLNDVLAPVENDMDGFTAYAAAKRAIELEGRKVTSGMPMPEANAVVAAGAQRYEPVFRELVGYQDRVLDNLQKSGILSAADVQKMRALNSEYVPYYRLIDPKSDLGQQVGSGLTVRDPVFGIKGSAREILNPIDSIIKNTYTMTSLAERNRALQALEDWNARLPKGSQVLKPSRDVHPIGVSPNEINQFIQQHGIPGSVSDALTIFRPNAFRPSDDAIRLFRDGKSKVYKVDEPIAKAVNAMDRESLNVVFRILGAPARLLRAGAVLSPEFIARNPVRDQFSAYAFSKYGYVPVYDMARGLGSLFRKDAAYQSWLIHGGANATLVGLDRAAIGLDPKTLVSRVKNVITSPIEALRTASELMENATRLGEFKRGIEQGATPTEAAFSSREVTLDFARAGAKTKALNAIIPFFNAQIEGVDRAARAFRDNPANFLTKVGASITLPSVMLWFANKDDQRYKELPAWQKDFFWIVPTDHWVNMDANAAAGISGAYKRQLPNEQWQRNDGTVWRIPKPFELGVLFGSVPERALEAFYARNPNAFKDLHKSVIQALTPNYMPQAVLPFMEQFANRSQFLDRPLVPKSLEGVAPKYQAGPQTSETAKAIGSGISKIAPASSFASPMVIDNYIRQWTGGLGAYGVAGIDKLIRPADAPAKPEATLADMPLVKGFVARFPSANVQSVEDFYNTYGERKQAKTTATYLQKSGQPADADIKIEPRAEGAYKTIGQLNKSIRNVYQDKNMSPQEKRQAIDQYYLKMITAAQKGLESMRRTSAQPAQQQLDAVQ